MDPKPSEPEKPKVKPKKEKKVRVKKVVNPSLEIKVGKFEVRFD
jgi:hypothetical protein